MPRFTKLLTDEISQSCINLYNKLPKTGKPIVNEWTVLSCIIQYDNLTLNHEVVSLGTGSKCIGATKMSSSGDILNDSHAEVIARRGFLLYLYDNIDKAIENQQSIFIMENNRFILKKSIEFIFYSSQLPCGDASIIPQCGEEDNIGNVLQQYKHQAKHDNCDIQSKRQKLEVDVAHDIHRTGAKCLPHSEQDPKQPGINYHLLGQVRSKPGRGDRTLSVSCSDKMARWVHLGIQGGLLDMLLDEPIYVKHFIFGAEVPYSNEALNRALLNRDSKLSSYVIPILPEFYQCSLSFNHIKRDKSMRPAPGSIVWIKNCNQLLEVAIQGKKLGGTKKQANSLCQSLCFSKYNIYKRFQYVLHKNEALKQNIVGENAIENIPYNEMKRKAKRYSERWKEVKKNVFKTWTIKPDIWNFCVKIT